MNQKIVFGLTLPVAQSIKEEVEREILKKTPNIQSVSRYRREGIYQYVVKQQENNVLVILEELLQGRDSYPVNELQQLTDLGNNRVIFLLDRRHIGGDYVKALYCCGIYDGLYLDEATPKEILKLVWHSRTNEQARKYYGIQTFRDAEKDGNFVNEERLDLYMEYLEAEADSEELGEKYRFVSTRLGAEENRILAANLAEEVTGKIRGNEVFEFYKGTNKGKRRLFPWKKKAEKDTKPEIITTQTEPENYETVMSVSEPEYREMEEDEIFSAIDRFWMIGNHELEKTKEEMNHAQPDLLRMFGDYLKTIDA